MSDTERTSRFPKPAPGKPAPGKPAQGTPAQGKSAPGKPAGTSPAAQPAAAKPSATKPATKPAAAKPAADKSGPGLWERMNKAVRNASTEHKSNAQPGKASTSPRAPRRARLRLTRVDPWSVMKMSFLLSITFAIATFVSVMVLWFVLGAAGVWDSVNSAVAPLLEGDAASTFDVNDYVGMGRVLGFTTMVALLDIVLITAIATLGAFLYNMAAALLGGIDVTLVEDDR